MYFLIGDCSLKSKPTRVDTGVRAPSLLAGLDKTHSYTAEVSRFLRLRLLTGVIKGVILSRIRLAQPAATPNLPALTFVASVCFGGRGFPFPYCLSPIT